MMITGNEVAVDNQMRRAEKQNQSPVNRLLEGAESTAQAMNLEGKRFYERLQEIGAMK
jgi:hypothetical protein